MIKPNHPLALLPLVMLLAACAGERGEQITAEAGMNVVMVMPVNRLEPTRTDPAPLSDLARTNGEDLP